MQAIRVSIRRYLCNALPIVLLASTAISGWAAEGPFFVTYTHQMEEPGNLEVATKAATGRPAEGSRWVGDALELEYGAQGWWTTELYLDGETTAAAGALFTGYRWENRFRPLAGEHWINPVLYLEFENINAADRTLLEVVNHDGEDDLAAPPGEVRGEKQREIEAKLILGSYFKGWTLAENIIVEKNVGHEPYEFGYAVGISRPMALEARPNRCNFCLENLQAGVEIYGGLGTYNEFGLRGTSHYVAPVLSWTLANGTMVRVSPGFGVTPASAGVIWRFGVSYEIEQFGRTVHRLFRDSGGRS